MNLRREEVMNLRGSRERLQMVPTCRHLHPHKARESLGSNSRLKSLSLGLTIPAIVDVNKCVWRNE